MKDFFYLFFSKRLFKLFAELMTYSIKAVLKFYYLTIPFLVLVFGICYQYLGISSDNERLIFAIIAIYLLTAAPAMRVLYLKELKVVFTEGAMNFAILETLIISDKEYIDVDFDSARIEEKQDKLFRSLAQKQSVIDVFVFPKTLRLPRLYYLTKNLQQVKDSLQAYLGAEKYVSILVTTKDKDGSRIEFDVIYEKMFMHDKHLRDFWSNFNAVLPEGLLAEDYILEVSKIFTAQLTQSILDMAIGMQNFPACHAIVDDCLELFEQSFVKINRIVGTESNPTLESFKNDMIANMEVYRATAFLNQREPLAAVRHFFKAIKANPFFPYQHYSEFKEAYNKKYVAKVASSVELFEEAIDQTQEIPNPNREKFSTNDIRIDHDYPFAQFHEERLISVLNSLDSPEVNSVILKALQLDFAPRPISLIIKGELLKYIPKGKEKHEKMYVARIPEVIELFEEALEFDPEFALLHGRIGTLMFIQAMYLAEGKRDAHLKKAFERINRGREVFTRFGFEIRTKEQNNTNQ